MDEYKHGELKSGSGKKVQSRKQAIAIGLNEARRAGAKVPQENDYQKKGKIEIVNNQRDILDT